jgi:hypothetical protein
MLPVAKITRPATLGGIDFLSLLFFLLLVCQKQFFQGKQII